MLTLTPILSLFCLVFLFYHITLAFFTAPHYVPVDDITLDCGSATSNIRRIWMGETRVETFSPSSFPKTNIILNLIPLTLQKKAPQQKLPIRLHVYLILNSPTYFHSPLARDSFGCTLTWFLTMVMRGLRPLSLSKQVRSPYLETSLLPLFLLILCKIRLKKSSASTLQQIKN